MRKRIKDYAVGLTLATTIHILTIVVMDRVDHVIGEPGELEEVALFIVILGILHGWVLTYAARSQRSSRWIAAKIPDPEAVR